MLSIVKVLVKWRHDACVSSLVEVAYVQYDWKLHEASYTKLNSQSSDQAKLTFYQFCFCLDLTQFYSATFIG